MERSRPRLDPLLADQVNARLAFVLADRAPRRAQPAEDEPAGSGGAPPPDPSGPPAPASAGDSLDLGAVEDLPAARRFHRRHLAVLVMLVALGLIGGGWSLLRARPVAVASPTEVVVSVPATPTTPTIPAGGAASAAPSAAPVVVHVLGAVRRPGLVTLTDRTRVQDAIKAAGGFTDRADPGELNLAQLLVDGQQVVIGNRDKPAGEVRDAGSGPGPDPSTPSGGTALDLNRATEAQLEELPGVGPVMAGKIVAWRTEHSRFSRVEELQEVDGVGPKTYAQLAPHVRV